MSFELVQGLLSFAHMIMPIMWLHFQWLQMSLRSLCLLFREKPRAMNLALYPTMFPSTTWWNYKPSFTYRYCILDIILLELVFHFFLVTSSWLEGSVSMMSLYSSYYSSLWNVVTCSSEQVSFFLACRRLCMQNFLKSKCISMVRTFYKEYLYWQVLMHKYMIMQLL